MQFRDKNPKLMRTSARNLLDKFYATVPEEERKNFKTQLLSKLLSKYTNNLVISERALLRGYKTEQKRNDCK